MQNTDLLGPTYVVINRSANVGFVSQSGADVCCSCC